MEEAGFCTELSTFLFKTFIQEKYISRSSAEIVLREKITATEKSELSTMKRIS
jgi:hypothetical protein